MLVHSIAFDPANPAAALAQIPAQPGVFALFAAEEHAEPYLSRTPNLKRRLTRFLEARPSQTKRLRLTERIARIEYTLTGSDFESALCLYSASMRTFGDAAARKRMHLRPPYFLRMSSENAYPRIYVTNKITKSAFNDLFGPFPSRASAEKFSDEMLNLFELRRCHEDLNPDPAFPGCIYSEMKMCLAPCFKGCSDPEYRVEVERVEAYLDSSGRSLERELAGQREEASAHLEFENAAALHARLEKLKPVLAQLPEAVRRVDRLAGVIVQPAATEGCVALFRMDAGRLAGPADFPIRTAEHTKSQSMESRVASALDAIPRMTAARAFETMEHLAIFRRWYYRGTRVGEVFLADDKAGLPMRRIVRGISRVYRGEKPEAEARPGGGGGATCQGDEAKNP